MPEPGDFRLNERRNAQGEGPYIYLEQYMAGAAPAFRLERVADGIQLVDRAIEPFWNPRMRFDTWESVSKFQKVVSKALVERSHDT